MNSQIPYFFDRRVKDRNRALIHVCFGQSWWLSDGYILNALKQKKKKNNKKRSSATDEYGLKVDILVYLLAVTS